MRARVQKHALRQVLYEGRFLRLVRKGEWEYVERNNCSAIVIIAAITEEGQVIFVEQYRPPVGKKVIEFPAGLVNDHGAAKRESMVAAAKRELLEETGYRAESITKILTGPVSSGSSADLVQFYIAQGARRVTEGGGDDFESIVVHAIKLNQADRWLSQMSRKGYLIEPKIYTGLYFLKSYNR